ncbi:Translation factor guf1 mitochondrial [Sporothrix curviconia]|uniref:Translation factor guf1 mitochondrial n=1 Tax=Sporothrix curviconia TaxID=1260050 RepID=A0ABP0C476_9PEZI
MSAADAASWHHGPPRPAKRLYMLVAGRSANFSGDNADNDDDDIHSIDDSTTAETKARSTAAAAASAATTTTTTTTTPPAPQQSYSSKQPRTSKNPADIERRIAAIPIERFRNFCIVAHIDHGKSTLSDRLLEITGTISPGDGNKQILDKLDVERERGITVKAQTCTMIYRYKGLDYLLHLVDTPGHVDFRAEVTRSYASCGGALLLVDASQGVQAQTVANFYHAFSQGLGLIPVVNKVDLPTADVPRALRQLHDTFELNVDETNSNREAVLVSAKTGKNVEAILPAVIERIPAPEGDASAPPRILLVDSWYDTFRGVVLLVRVFAGTIKAGDQLISMQTNRKYTVGEVGIQYPDGVAQPTLRAGQVGYLFFNPGMKKIQDAKIGDTLTTVGNENIVEPYPGFEEPKPMVFVAAFPTDQGDHSRLADSISQLVLNDRSITLQKDHSEALGAGWRLGFLGSLHCSVFQDRLRQEHGASVIITEPAVPVMARMRDGTEKVLTSAAEFPDADEGRGRGTEYFEPYVTATITVPEEYLGRVITLCEASRGEQLSIDFMGGGGASSAAAAKAALAEQEQEDGRGRDRDGGSEVTAAGDETSEATAAAAAAASPRPMTTANNIQVILKYALPSMALVDDLFGKLKGASRGYATLDYEDAGWRSSDLVKLQLLVNKQPVDAIGRVMHRSQIDRVGRQWVTKFKEHVDRQMFEVIIQAAAGKRIVARETIKPFRKDVLAKLHASDITRRRKLLEKQKAGRKRLTAVGNVTIDHSAFQKFLSK